MATAFKTSSTSKPSPALLWGMSVGLGALGLFLVGKSLGVVGEAPASDEAPPLLMGLTGFILVVSGGVLLTPDESPWRRRGAGLIALGFALSGALIALFAKPGSIGGGLFFLPPEVNEMLGRIVFGLGSVVSLWLATAAFKVDFRSESKLS